MWPLCSLSFCTNAMAKSARSFATFRHERLLGGQQQQQQQVPQYYHTEHTPSTHSTERSASCVTAQCGNFNLYLLMTLLHWMAMLLHAAACSRQFPGTSVHILFCIVHVVSVSVQMD